MAKYRWRLLIVFIALSLFAIFATVAFRPMFVTEGCKWTHPDNTQRLEESERQVIAALTAYQASHQYFPATLALAGVSTDSPFGPWRYECDGKTFTLRLGDYGKCFWESSYSSETGTWYHDS